MWNLQEVQFRIFDFNIVINI